MFVTQTLGPFELQIDMLYCNYSITDDWEEKEMAIVQQVQKRMLISLAQIAKDVNLHEGDHVVIEEMNGGIFLRPVDWVDKNQKYFWTEEWQRRILQSQQDLESGDYQTFENMEDAVKELEELANANRNKDKKL